MYVCVCNALTDREVRACAGAVSVTDVYRRCGCAPRCGKCVPAVREILQELQGRAVPVGPPASDASAA